APLLAAHALCLPGWPPRSSRRVFTRESIMSRRALYKAMRDFIQARLGLDSDSCEIGFSGKPKPSCGELYVAIHPLPTRMIVDGDVGVGKSYGGRVTITRRLGYSPDDRRGIEIWLKDDEGVEAIAEVIIRELAGDSTGSLDTQSRYALIRRANA